MPGEDGNTRQNPEVSPNGARPPAQALAEQGGPGTRRRKQTVDVTLQQRRASHAEVDGSLSSPRRDLPSR